MPIDPGSWTTRKLRSHVARRSALLCVVVAALTLSAPRDPDYAAVDAYVKQAMQRDRVPGLALAIVRDGALVHARGFGTAGGENRPVTPQSVFVLGSMSKAFTAIAVMQLAAAGKVDLDAPVKRYLPWFRSSEPIKLRHLLHHTSGIPRRVPRAAESPPTLESHVRALQDVELVHSPGDAHVYSSSNYQVLGLILEQVSGQPFGQYVKQHIFTPLGMSNSHTEAKRVAPEALAEGHSMWLGSPRVSRQRHEVDRLPTAALLSSAEDLSHLLIALSAGGRHPGGRILSEASTSKLLRPLAKGNGFSYAMGFRVGEIGGVRAIHHGGIVSNYRGKMVLLPEHKTGVVVLTNVSSVVGKPTSHVIANGVALMLAGKSPPRPGLSLSTWYLLIGLGMLIFSAELIFSVVRLRKWRPHVRSVRGDRRAILRSVALPVAWGAGMPALLLAGLPVAFALSWGELIRYLPDVSWFLLVFCPLEMLVAGYKAWVAVGVLAK